MSHVKLGFIIRLYMKFCVFAKEKLRQRILNQFSENITKEKIVGAQDDLRRLRVQLKD